MTEQTTDGRANGEQSAQQAMAHKATFRFHGPITFFLPPKQRDTIIEHTFDWRASIKDMVESLGPPHSEIGLLVVDGQSVDFSYIIESDVHVDVYSRLDSVDLPNKIALRPPFPGQPRFVLDTHLGRLANSLRMMGFDTLYRNDYPDDELAQVSSEEQRILLTRDVGLLKRSLVVYGHYVRATDPREQIVEVMKRYALVDKAKPFHRCITCNDLLHPVNKADIIDQLPETSAGYFDEYSQCQGCGKIYWKGSHYDRMQEIIDQVIASVDSEATP